MKLRISNDLVLGADFVTSTSAILAKKRVGKTYLAQKIAEGLLAAHQQVVVIDMTSAWWGLRSSADGTSAGYPITIFGGKHGDVPLEATAGEMLAEAIVKDRFSAVLDVRLLKKGQRIRFIADFLEALYDKNTEAMHLFMDEADAYIPQRSFSPEEARALGAADELVRRGGIGGIGVTMISQRPQVLNKNVLSQVDTLSILRMNHPKDIDAVEDWMKNHADGPLIKEILSSLSSLPRGDAWHLDPEHKVFKRISVSPKTTFDSGRTPKVGERIKPPKVLAKVDLERLGESIRETVQRAQENDPKTLRLKITELIKERDQLSQTVNTKGKAVIETKIVEKPVITDKQLVHINKIVDRGQALVDKLAPFAEELSRVVGDLRGATSAVQLWRPPTIIKPLTTAPRPSPRPLSQPSRPQAVESVPEGISKAELKILGACAWMEAIGQPIAPSTAVAFVAGYTENGHFNNMKGRLKSAGFVDYPGGGMMQLTDVGRAVAPSVSVPQTVQGLHDAVRARLKPGLTKLLDPLLDAYPEAMHAEQLAEAADYTINGHFNNMRGKLHTLGLVTYPNGGYVRAADILFPKIHA